MRNIYTRFFLLLLVFIFLLLIRTEGRRNFSLCYLRFLSAVTWVSLKISLGFSASDAICGSEAAPPNPFHSARGRSRRPRRGMRGRRVIGLTRDFRAGFTRRKEWISHPHHHPHHHRHRRRRKKHHLFRSNSALTRRNARPDRRLAALQFLYAGHQDKDAAKTCTSSSSPASSEILRRAKREKTTSNCVKRKYKSIRHASDPTLAGLYKSSTYKLDV